MDICSQALSSRQRAPPSVYPSANWVRAPPHVGEKLTKRVASMGLECALGWTLGTGAVRGKIGFAAG